MKKISSILLLVVNMITVFAISPDSTHCRRPKLFSPLVDCMTNLSNDTLHQYKIEENDRHINVRCYKNGVLDGRTMSFRKRNGKCYIYVIGQYKKGVPIGDWLFFHEQRGTFSMFCDVKPNADFMEEAIRSGYYHPQETYQAYVYDFELGELKAEGNLIFHKDYMEDEVTEVGIWKIYSTDGNVHTKDYSETF